MPGCFQAIAWRRISPFAGLAPRAVSDACAYSERTEAEPEGPAAAQPRGALMLHAIKSHTFGSEDDDADADASVLSSAWTADDSLVISEDSDAVGWIDIGPSGLELAGPRQLEVVPQDGHRDDDELSVEGSIGTPHSRARTDEDSLDVSEDSGEELELRRAIGPKMSL